MPISRGKSFEANFWKQCRDEGINIDRLRDPTSRYLGIRNPSDFIVYLQPYQYYLELKAYRKNVLSFKVITQWDELVEKSAYSGVMAGVIVWFIDHDLTIFVPIQELVRLKELGKKSLNVKDISSLETYILLTGKKKQIYFNYDIRTFFARLSSLENFLDSRQI